MPRFPKQKRGNVMQRGKEKWVHTHIDHDEQPLKTTRTASWSPLKDMKFFVCEAYKKDKVGVKEGE